MESGDQSFLCLLLCFSSPSHSLHPPAQSTKQQPFSSQRPGSTHYHEQSSSLISRSAIADKKPSLVTHGGPFCGPLVRARWPSRKEKKPKRCESEHLSWLRPVYSLLFFCWHTELKLTISPRHRSSATSAWIMTSSPRKMKRYL